MRKYEQAIQSPGRKHHMYRYNRMMMLSDYEIFFQLMKLIIAIGIFYRPFLVYKGGLYWALIGETVAWMAVIATN